MMKKLSTLLFLILFISLSPLLASPAEPGEALNLDPEYVSFTLRNNSLKAIPLDIPGVMKPNLSPVSKSKVSLAVGQKIHFKYKGKPKLLLVVTKDLEGKTISVPKLVRERKKQLEA